MPQVTLFYNCCNLHRLGALEALICFWVKHVRPQTVDQLDQIIFIVVSKYWS